MPRACLALLLCWGCSSADTLFVPAPEGWTSALVAIYAGDTLRRFDAHEGSDALRVQPQDDEDGVIAVFYGGALADLGLREGPIQSAAVSRALPPMLGAVARTREVEAAAIEPSDPRILALQLPELDADACGLTQRCLAAEGSSVACSPDCGARAPRPDPVVAEPAAPQLPARRGRARLVRAAPWGRRRARGRAHRRAP